MRPISLVVSAALAAACVLVGSESPVRAMPNPCTNVNIHPNSNALPNGQIGQPYCQPNVVKIWVTPNTPCIPIIWTVTAGSLPNGLSLVSSSPNQADLCGTPAGPIGPSTFTITAQATYVCGTVCFLSQTYTVSVF